MIYRINHATTYFYQYNVSLCHNIAHLTPREHPQQDYLSGELTLSVPPAVSVPRTDYFGNRVTFFTVQVPHNRLEVTSANVVEVRPASLPEPDQTGAWEEAWRALRHGRDPQTLDAYQFAFDSHYIQRSPELAEYARLSFSEGRPFLEALLDLTGRIFHDFRFDPYATTIGTPLLEVLANRRGVCQDFAHLEIGCLRSIGLAARYVSGYLLTNPPPGQPRLVGADVSHAWLSVYCPGFGWIDLDPTNNVVPGTRHITLAWGRDYDDVSPIKGVILGGGRHSVAVSVDVTPVTEEPPPTLGPASDGSADGLNPSSG